MKRKKGPFWVIIVLLVVKEGEASPIFGWREVSGRESGEKPGRKVGFLQSKKESGGGAARGKNDGFLCEGDRTLLRRNRRGESV